MENILKLLSKKEILKSINQLKKVKFNKIEDFENIEKYIDYLDSIFVYKMRNVIFQ